MQVYESNLRNKTRIKSQDVIDYTESLRKIGSAIDSIWLSVAVVDNSPIGGAWTRRYGSGGC